MGEFPKNIQSTLDVISDKFSPEQREIIKSLPNAAQVLLVLEGLKPATEVFAVDDHEKIKQDLENMGLCVVEKDWKEGKLFNVSKDLSVVKEIDIIAGLVRGGEGKNTPELDRRYGELMGFPSTAIDAYISGNTLPEEEEKRLKEEMGFDNIFFPFKLSQEHYRDELVVLKQWYKTLLEDCPEIIDQVISEEDRQRFKDAIRKFID